jgi:hypothetical protein
MFTRRSFSLTAVVLLSLTVVPEAFARHAWNKYHWGRTSNPFTIKLGNTTTTSYWSSLLSEASVDWSKSTLLDTTVVSSNGTAPGTCAPTTGRVEVCNANYGDTGWLGVAQIWTSSGTHIAKGAAKMNDYYHNTAPYNSTAWRDLVMCQEVGHTFGLGHQDETHGNVNLGSCMDYTNDPDGGAGGASETDPANLAPNKHDYDQLIEIYKHTDAINTISLVFDDQVEALSRPSTIEEILFDANNFGTPLAFDGEGRPNVFKLVLNPGTDHGDDDHHDIDGEYAVITHVFWLPRDPAERGRPLRQK